MILLTNQSPIVTLYFMLVTTIESVLCRMQLLETHQQPVYHLEIRLFLPTQVSGDVYNVSIT